MINLRLIILSLFISGFAFAQEADFKAKNNMNWSPQKLSGINFKQMCSIPLENEEHIFQDDLKFGIPLAEMKLLFEKLYNEPKRMFNRAFWSEKQQSFIIPIEMPKEMSGSQNSLAPAVLDLNFIASVKSHLETALERGHADFGFFGDMGHNHFLIPKKTWDEEYNNLDFKKRNELYTKLYSDSRLKMLYHTAELLKMHDDNNKLINDPYVQYRYYTRNIVGTNNGQKSLDVYFDKSGSFNTVGASSFKDYYWWSGGIYLHSNQQGCFEYEAVRDGKTEILRFDLSNTPTPMRPSTGEASGF
jgi:hypothetical protein